MPQLTESPFAPFFRTHGVVVLDGGLATELEARGHDLDHPLWSAQVLRTDPDAIAAVHTAYLSAGADCISTASYQVSLPGLAEYGASAAEAETLLRESVAIAIRVRNEVAAERREGILPLVAASVGPYGAYRADGSEYTGDYAATRSELREFHRRRWDILADTPADLLACETVPNVAEAEVLRELLGRSPLGAWVSFCCRNGRELSDGTPIEHCASLFKDCPGLLALGVNCSAPEHVTSLVARLRGVLPATPIVAYGNSGEVFDASDKTWSGAGDAGSAAANFARHASDWIAAGASLVGGCCRTGPAHIQAIRDQVGS